MKKIINTSENDLFFPKFDLRIQSKEIKKIDEKVFEQITGNMFIKEVIQEEKVVKNKINKK
jgi:hypothetical protein